MKIQLRLLILLPVFLLAACETASVSGEYQRQIAAQGFTAYYRPSGDTLNVKDWDKYGPGTILRSKQQTYYEPARTVIGTAGVKAAMKPENSSPISIFKSATYSGSDLDGKGGWSLDAVNQIAGAIHFKKDTTVDLSFGKTYLANFKSEGEMHRALRAAVPKLDSTTRKALRGGSFAVVQHAVYADSIRYIFKQAKEGGGSATYKLGPEEIAALTAKGYRIVDGGIEVSQPTFIAFTPLPEAGRDMPSK